jgi:glycosyltransferase involved in cell wall biosynthesis
MKVSVVVPCYNEEFVIAETNSQLNSVLSSYFEDYEIIYVNDGSKDGTKALLLAFKDKFPNIKSYTFFKKFWASTCCVGRH